MRDDPIRDESIRDEPIRDDSIRLGQFLKLAGLIEVGGDARAVLGAERVRVNGEVEARRGRQLRVGDLVELDGDRVRVVPDPDARGAEGQVPSDG